MKLGKYLKSLATTDIDMYSEFSHQYSHMPYDEAQQYREYLLSLSISDVEDIFEKIIKAKASFTDINLDNNKEKFIAFLKAFRRPEDDINDWIKIKENKTKTNKKDSVSFKLNTTNEKIADFYSYLVKMNYLEERACKRFYICV